LLSFVLKCISISQCEFRQICFGLVEGKTGTVLSLIILRILNSDFFLYQAAFITLLCTGSQYVVVDT